MQIDNQQGSMLNKDLQKLMLHGIDVTSSIYSKFSIDETIKFIVNLNQSYEFFNTEMGLTKDQVKRIKRKVTTIYMNSIPTGFRSVEGHEEYLVNYKGQIITKKTRRVLKQSLSKKGNYCTVCLTNKDSLKVHRIVAKTFIPNPENKPEVNHKDGIKTNNWVDNLEWNTAKENLQHKKEHNLGKTDKAKESATGENNSQAKLSEEDVKYIRNNYNNNAPRLALTYNVSTATIYDIINRRSWTHI